MVLLIEMGILLATLSGIVWFIATKIQQLGLGQAVKVSLLGTLPLAFLAGPVNYIVKVILALLIQIFIRWNYL